MNQQPSNIPNVDVEHLLRLCNETSEMFDNVLWCAESLLNIAENRKKNGRNKLFDNHKISDSLDRVITHFENLEIIPKGVTIHHSSYHKTLFAFLRYLHTSVDIEGGFLSDYTRLHDILWDFLKRYAELTWETKLKALIEKNRGNYYMVLESWKFHDPEEYIVSFVQSDIIPLIWKEAFTDEELHALKSFMYFLYESEIIDQNVLEGYISGLPNIKIIYDLLKDLLKHWYFSVDAQLFDSIRWKLLDFYAKNKHDEQVQEVAHINNFDFLISSKVDDILDILFIGNLTGNHKKECIGFIEYLYVNGKLTGDEKTFYLEFFEEDALYAMYDVLRKILWMKILDDDIETLHSLMQQLVSYYNSTQREDYAQEVILYAEHVGLEIPSE